MEFEMEDEPKSKLPTARKLDIHPDHGNITIMYEPKTVIFTGHMYPSFVKAILGNIETPEEKARVLQKSPYPPMKPLSDKFGVIMSQVRVHNNGGYGGYWCDDEIDNMKDLGSSPEDTRDVGQFMCGPFC